MSEALAQEWAPCFAPMDPDVADAARILRGSASTFDFSDVPPPVPADYVRFLRRVPNSSPGLDGFPFAAWRETGDAGARHLWRTQCWMAQGLPMPWGFNDVIQIFIPKGALPEDEPRSCVRQAGATRPLALKNTDNKAICAVSNAALKERFIAGAHPWQTGFVPTRNFLANVVDLDSHARWHPWSRGQLCGSRCWPSSTSGPPSRRCSTRGCSPA